MDRRKHISSRTENFTASALYIQNRDLLESDYSEHVYQSGNQHFVEIFSHYGATYDFPGQFTNINYQLVTGYCHDIFVQQRFDKFNLKHAPAIRFRGGPDSQEVVKLAAKVF